VGKGRDRRRKARKERAFAPKPPSPPPEPLDRERALARFSNLRGRSVTLGFVAAGPTVQARAPQELEAAVEAWAVDEATKQEPS
jgi:hypothetical protein